MKSIPEIQEAFDSGEPLYRDPEVLDLLFEEIGFSPTTIAKRIFKGEITPNAIRYHLRKQGHIEPKDKVEVTIGSKGYTQIRHNDKEVGHHRLLACLVVDEVSELKEKRVSFKDGNPLNVCESNLSVGSIVREEPEEDSELSQIKEMVDAPVEDPMVGDQIRSTMESQGFSEDDIEEVLV